MLPKNLQKELATLREDFLNFCGLTNDVIWNLDPTLEARDEGEGLLLYDNLERDTHCQAVLHKRKNAVIRLPYEVQSASNSRADKKAADLVLTQLENLSVGDYPGLNRLEAKGFDGICYELLDAILKGYAVAEINWQRIGSEIVATEIKPKDQRRFAFILGDNGAELRLLTRTNRWKGVPVPDRKFIVHQVGGKGGVPQGRGLGSSLFYPVWFKRQDMSFWLQYSETAATGIPLGEYDAGASDKDLQALEDALNAIKAGTTVRVPRGMAVRMLEMVRYGSVDYSALARYCDEQVSEAALGETGSTNQSGSGGSRARDEVGNSVRLEILLGDSDLLAETLNATLVPWICYLNDDLLSRSTPPKVVRVLSEDQERILNLRKLKAEGDKILFDLGYRPTLERITQEYGEGYEPVQPLTPAPLPRERGAAPSLSDSLPGQAPQFAAPPPDTVQVFLAKLQAQAQGEVEQWWETVRKAYEGSGDLAEFQAKIGDLYEKLDGENLAGLMAQAMFASRLAGIYEAEQGE